MRHNTHQVCWLLLLYTRYASCHKCDRRHIRRCTWLSMPLLYGVRVALLVRVTVLVRVAVLVRDGVLVRVAVLVLV